MRSAFRALADRWGIRVFVILPAIVYLAAILSLTLVFVEDMPAAGWVGLGIVVAVVVVMATVTIIGLERITGAAGEQPVTHRAIAADQKHRLLLVADASCLDGGLCSRLLGELKTRPDEVLVIAPLFPSRMRMLFDDEDAARRDAQSRLEAALGGLGAARIPAHGHLGSDEPLEAIEAGLTEFAASEIAIVTPPPEQESWLEHDLVERARKAVELPITHIEIERAERPVY